jgi:ribA/ribD-fused uncharacterized protein
LGGHDEDVSVTEIPRNLEALCSAARSGTWLKYVFFWGHTAKTSGRIGKECLSQWYPAPFVIDGRRFATAEHYMMYCKAVLFRDHETAERVLTAPTPGAAKALGRAVRGFNEETWLAHRYEIALTGNRGKFGQSPELRAFLMGTNTRILVEASPVDRIWGVGLAEDDEHIENPARWQGLNRVQVPIC